ncbi:replication-associated protein [Nimphelosvirus isildur]|uniref:Replication-associated protein n=1 Tax=Entamoeba-associated CRESS DNA virus 1 TaxID=2766561 RepID=A0AAE7JDC5_9VIRU|nr:replication-associated protein [Entamoeba-associated CRESS DNA virus 1]QNJ47524.1 replication-associated protein [Entamoeba-associated CRESS DNA virus 1]
MLQVRPVARRFQLTLNQPEHYVPVKDFLLSNPNFKYLISCQEKAPTTGHDHIHIFVCFSKTVRLNPSLLHGAHIELCRGSNKQNVAYIRKHNEILDEIGECPVEGRPIKTVKDLLEIDDPETVPAYYLKSWREVKTMFCSMTIDDVYKPNVEIYFIWGKSGVGKSKKVFELIKSSGEQMFDVIHYDNGFFTGIPSYGCSSIGWYDDFRDSDMKPSVFIRFIDYYISPLNIKGGHVMNRYEKIYITSVQNPRKIYAGLKSDEPRKQWLRRMKIIHLRSLEAEGDDSDTEEENPEELAGNWS